MPGSSPFVHPVITLLVYAVSADVREITRFVSHPAECAIRVAVGEAAKTSLPAELVTDGYSIKVFRACQPPGNTVTACRPMAVTSLGNRASKITLRRSDSSPWGLLERTSQARHRSTAIFGPQNVRLFIFS